MSEHKTVVRWERQGAAFTDNRSSGRRGHPPGGSPKREFAADYRRKPVRGAGHFVPREQPEAIVAALVDGV